MSAQSDAEQALQYFISAFFVPSCAIPYVHSWCSTVGVRKFTVPKHHCTRVLVELLQQISTIALAAECDS